MLHPGTVKKGSNVENRISLIIRCLNGQQPEPFQSIHDDYSEGKFYFLRLTPFFHLERKYMDTKNHGLHGWGRMEIPTPTALNSKAQCRAAHAGLPITLNRTPTGFHNRRPRRPLLSATQHLSISASLIIPSLRCLAIFARVKIQWLVENSELPEIQPLTFSLQPFTLLSTFHY